MITSRHNPKVGYVARLVAERRFRQTEGRTVLEGPRLVEDALDTGVVPALALLAPERMASPLAERLLALGVPTLAAAPDLLAAASDTVTPQGVLAVVALPEAEPPTRVSLALVIDGVQDPGNVGALVRTAAAADCDLVLVAPGSADPLGPKALRGAMGAQFRLPVLAAGWPRIATELAETVVVCADAAADDAYWDYDWRPPAALVIGAEARGISPAGQALAARRVAIPMARATESLNAGAAAAVILFEVRRQRASAPPGN